MSDKITGLVEISRCPLCGTADRSNHSHSSPNLYSERLACLLSINEADLIAAMPNVQCSECDLIYKSLWFQTGSLTRLFNEIVPLHPKGWDAISSRFSVENFEIELGRYEKSIETENEFEKARWRRSLLSIVDSIPAVEEGSESAALQTAIVSADIAAVRRLLPWLGSVMNQPAPFKRFSGFRSRDMWNWCEQMIGPINSYAEIGCPLWGLLPVAAEQGSHTVFLRRPEPNYWSDACRSGGQHCIDHLRRNPAITVMDLHAVETDRYSLIGAFQYLDHLERPVEFMRRLFSIAPAVGLILDRFSQPTALQHFTGWTDQAVEWLARYFGKAVYSEFLPIRQSGNYLYLIADPA